MKTLHRALSRTLVALTLLACALALAPEYAAAQSSSGVSTFLPLQTGSNPNGRLRFTKLASTDSTQVAIGVWGPSTTVAAAEDTTAWFDTAGYTFPQVAAANSPYVMFQINTQTSGDSVGYTLQYTSDAATAAPAAGVTAASRFTTGAVVYTTSSNAGTAIPIIAVDNDDANGRWVRLILRNADISTNATRLFSVVPILRALK